MNNIYKNDKANKLYLHKKKQNYKDYFTTQIKYFVKQISQDPFTISLIQF